MSVRVMTLLKVAVPRESTITTKIIWTGSMKRHVLPFLAALALPFACTIVEEPKGINKKTEHETTHLVISANSSAMTKAVLKEDRSVSFVDADVLSVFDSEYQNCIFTVKNLYPDGSADFEGDVSAADGPMPVMYPYQEGARIEEYGPAHLPKLYFTVPSEQHAVENSFDPAAAFSIGLAEQRKDGIVGASLSNKCALVKFTMPKGSYSKVMLTVRGGTICGACYVDIKSGGISDIFPSETVKTVTLSGEIAGYKTYYMSVIPGIAEGGIDVKIYDANGDLSGEKSTTQDVTFTKGGILNIGTLPTAETSPDWLGEGTKASPYIIANADHLKKLEKEFSTSEGALPLAGKYFKQIKDIDMGGEAISIGNIAIKEQGGKTWDEPTSVFNANYDGGGHTISNYRLKFRTSNLTARYLAGLFNIVSDCTICNLNIQPAVQESGYLIDSIDTFSNHYYIGLLAGEIDGECTISNCHVLKGDYKITAKDKGASVESSQTVVLGGLVGFMSCGPYSVINFSNCTNEANLTIEKGRHKDVAGGIIGMNYGRGQIQYVDRCRNKGNITVISELEGTGLEVFAGGIIGRITDDDHDVVFRISNCVNEGDIYAKNLSPEYACAGGIAGSNDSDGYGLTDPWVYNCLNKGDIYAECLDGMWHIGYDACAGGIFGYCYDDDTHLALCVNVGRISAEGSPQVGPICGEEGDHLWCYWLETDEFEGYVPDSCTNCRACEFILGTGEDDGTPESVRLNGNSSYDTTKKSLFEMTEWDKSQWASAASWTGKSDLYWDKPTHENNLDLIF